MNGNLFLAKYDWQVLNFSSSSSIVDEPNNDLHDNSIIMVTLAHSPTDI